MIGRLIGWIALVGTLSGLNYASRFAADDAVPAERDFFYRWDVAVLVVIQFGIMLLIVLWIVRGRSGELLALRRPVSWGRAALLAFGVLVATAVIANLVGPALDVEDEQGLVPQEWDPDRAAPFAVNAALTALYVPVVEELAFRGAGFSLLARFGPTAAAVATGIAFGVAHGLVRGLPILVALGIGLGLLRAFTRSVYPCVALHAIFNAISLITVVFRDPVAGT